MSDIERVLKFWLDDVGSAGWYEVDAEVDRRITTEFAPLWQAAMAGDLACWINTARGALALLILTDQFPRNMFRGTANAYASDRLARRIARHAIKLRHDRATPEPERQFFYLPLMHSETLADQERCVRLLMLHMPVAGPHNLPHAVKHREVIRHFGRFPSRNTALGRAYSDAELAYRAAGGYMS